MPSCKTIVGAAAALLVLLLVPTGPVLSHQLTVFAFVEKGWIVVEAKFSSGRLAREGLVTVYDDANAVVHETTLGHDGIARLPLIDHEGGLKIEVTAGEGHSSYWILTPQDIDRQASGAGAQP